jgi:LDH2 family malate/lactate/ureidoglycolate dehydrogenase
MVIVSEDDLRELCEETLRAAGTPPDEAAWVSDCLVLSNLKGVDSHGVQQIPGYVKAIEDGFLKPGQKPTLIEERAATALYNGNWGYGYTIAREVMQETLRRARKAGIAFSGIRNVHHIGRVGRWAEMALEEGMIGIASQPGGVYIAPWGGIDRKLPIAPIALAAPAGKHRPIVVDMSLGPIAGGRTAILAVRGLRVPEGWYVDDEGKPHDNPVIFNSGRGAQLPLGQPGLGYKGMALSMMVNILAGPLLGHVTTRDHAFTTPEAYAEGMEAFVDDIKSSRLAKGFEEITVPGEPEWRELDKRKKEGIYLDDEIYQRILDTAGRLGLDTAGYKGRPGKPRITHPSYTLEHRYG